MAKADNLLAVLWLLQSRKQLTAAQIAEELEISVRTVYRYVDALCASGVPIAAEAGHDGGFYLMPNFVAAPLFFSHDELKAIFQASLFAKQGAFPQTAALDQALQKITQQLNPEQLGNLQTQLKSVDVLRSQRYPVDLTALQTLEQATIDKQTVEMHYQKRKHQDPQVRKLNPYGLVHWQARWYVVGYCHLRREVRIFRIDRVAAVHLTPIIFDPPEISVSEYFWQQMDWHHTAKETTRVCLTGESRTLDEISENSPFRQQVIQRTDQQLELIVHKHEENYFCRHLLSYGDRVRVVSPLDIQAQLTDIASRIIKQYPSS